MCRVDLLQDVLVEIERFTPRDFSGLEEAREFIRLAAVTTKGHLAMGNRISEREKEKERRAFLRYIEKTKKRELSLVDPVPFRRVLGRIEGKQIHNRLTKKWGTHGFGWYAPTDSRNPNIEVFTDRHFQEDLGAAPIRAILAENGTSRLWELRQFGPSYELDLDVVDLQYCGSQAYSYISGGGCEAYWFAMTMDWIIYIDKEGEITIGGWLLDALKKVWNNWSERRAPRWDPDNWRR